MNGLRSVYRIGARGALVLVVLPILTLSLSSPLVLAQCPPPPPTSQLEPGEIGLFFDPLGRETCGYMNPGSVTPLYVVTRVPDGGVEQFEMPELMSDDPPPGWLVTGLPILLPGGPFEQLIVIDACQAARAIDPNTCPVEPGDILVISVIEVVTFQPLQGTACFQSSCTTIAGPVAGNPHYLNCSDEWHQFHGGESMCIGFGEAPTPVTPSTWGHIKALYEGP